MGQHTSNSTRKDGYASPSVAVPACASLVLCCSPTGTATLSPAVFPCSENIFSHPSTHTHIHTRYIGTVARFWLDFLLFRCRLAHQTIESCNFPHIHQHTRMNDHTHTQPNTHTYGCIRVPHQVKTEIPGRLMRSFLSFVAVLRHGIFAIRAVRLCTIVRSLQ